MSDVMHRGPGRPRKEEGSRAETVRRERRRKMGSANLPDLRLHVDPGAKDAEMTYRWVKDEPARVARMEAQDWDVSKLGGQTDSRHGGKDDNGRPYGMILMEKPKEWHDADNKEKADRLREVEAQMRSGKHESEKELAAPGVSYTPDGLGNTIKRAS